MSPAIPPTDTPPGDSGGPMRVVFWSFLLFMLLLALIGWGQQAWSAGEVVEPVAAAVSHETHWDEILKGVGGGAGGLGTLVALLIALGKMGVLPAITIGGGKKPVAAKDDPDGFDGRLDELEAAVLPKRGKPLDDRVQCCEDGLRELRVSNDRILAELAQQREQGDRILAALTAAASQGGGH